MAEFNQGVATHKITLTPQTDYPRVSGKKTELVTFVCHAFCQRHSSKWTLNIGSRVLMDSHMWLASGGHCDNDDIQTRKYIYWNYY